jgi:D-3-phosphoglycerate dehydrogenase
MARQLKGATRGIIGYGVIGGYLADLVAKSDFVVCLAIANEETVNLMNAAAFAAIKPSAYFINLSRGNLVDEAALEAALAGRILEGATNAQAAHRPRRFQRR